jgi:protein-disulfide isomerase
MLKGEIVVLDKVLSVVGVMAVGFCLSAAAQNGGPSPVATSDTVLMQVNGVKITAGDLEHQRAGALFQSRNNYYEAERKALLDLADEALLDQQAAKEGITVEQLLKKHVDSTLPPDPSDEALHVYYEGVETTQPFEAMRGKILDSIRARRVSKAQTAYLESLRSHASISILLAPPRAPISIKDVAVREEGAPQVTLLEYADYECPYCQQAEPVVEKIEAEFKGKVAFAFKDFPLPMHAHAEKAAEASRCAAVQGKYWEYHDLLFASKKLDVDSLKKDASDLKLDTAAFDSCLDAGKMAGEVKAEASEAQSLGIAGTPTFFVNGRAVSGTNYEKIRAVIDEELQAMSIRTAAASAKPATENRQQDESRSH